MSFLVCFTIRRFQNADKKLIKAASRLIFRLIMAFVGDNGWV